MTDDHTDAEEEFVTALADAMEANAELLEQLAAIRGDQDVRGPVSRGAVEGIASRIERSNQQLKRIGKRLAVEVPTDGRPSNWDDVLTMED